VKSIKLALCENDELPTTRLLVAAGFALFAGGSSLCEEYWYRENEVGVKKQTEYFIFN